MYHIVDIEASGGQLLMAVSALHFQRDKTISDNEADGYRLIVPVPSPTLAIMPYPGDSYQLVQTLTFECPPLSDHPAVLAAVERVFS